MQDGDWLEAGEWAEELWGQAELGDQRRTKRVVRLAAQLAAQPGQHLPQQCGNWADLKAAYRLLNHPALTPAQLSRPVWQTTLTRARQAHGPVLFIQDGSELNFTHHPKTKGLGYGGNPQQRSLLLHSMLCIQPQGERQHLQVLGVAAQRAWIRTELRGKEQRKERYERWNENDVWGDLLALSGPPPEQTHWVCVSDRGSDDYGYFLEAQRLGWHLLARAARTRRVEVDGQAASLFPAVRAQPSVAQVALHLRGREGQAAQTLTLNVSFTPVTLQAPKNGPHREAQPLAMWAVRAWSASSKHEWILLSTVPVLSVVDALERVNWYAHRWVIEEYHKALKTGCQFEARQLESADGLQRLLSLLSPVAARLLALRSLSRTAGDELATAHLPLALVRLVVRKGGRSTTPEAWTLRDFWRGVAQLGGFLGRKHDGEPGWQTLWRGWLRVLDMAWAAEIDVNDAAPSICG